MPLGKISKDQLLKGFQTLNDLMKALEEEKEMSDALSTLQTSSSR